MEAKLLIYQYLLIKAVLCHLSYEPAVPDDLGHPTQGLASRTSQDRVGAAQCTLGNTNP